LIAADRGVICHVDKRLDFRYSIPTPARGPVVELSALEAERILLTNLAASKDDPIAALWELARFYSEQKQHVKALACLRQLLDRFPDLERKASCVLAMGQTMERVNDYPAAIRYYKEALSLEPVQNSTWYLINNNLGFCLNALGHCADSETYCRRAIQIDPNRPNAHKNLGIALTGLGNYIGAAQSFVSATQANAADGRASKLLDTLLSEHPELQFQFGDQAEFCRKAVAVAAHAHNSVKPVVHTGLPGRLILLWARCRRWWRRAR
jgi:tetratricopeptide (TPR) repeat protein